MSCNILSLWDPIDDQALWRVMLAIVPVDQCQHRVGLSRLVVVGP